MQPAAANNAFTTRHYSSAAQSALSNEHANSSKHSRATTAAAQAPLAAPPTPTNPALSTTADSSGLLHPATGATSPYATSERSAEGSRVSGTDSLLGISHATAILLDHQAGITGALSGVVFREQPTGATVSVHGWHSSSGSSLLGTNSPLTASGTPQNAYTTQLSHVSRVRSDEAVSVDLDESQRLVCGARGSFDSGTNMPPVTVAAAVPSQETLPVPSSNGNILVYSDAVGSGNAAVLSPSPRMRKEPSTALSASFFSVASLADQTLDRASGARTPRKPATAAVDRGAGGAELK